MGNTTRCVSMTGEETVEPTRLLHRHCGEALHFLLEHEAGLVFLILDQLAVADDLAQFGDS